MGFEADLATLLLLLLTGLAAGTIDAMAGGGGMLTIPMLMAVGLTPQQALATNKLQGTFGTLAATRYFLARRQFSLGEMKWMVLTAALGTMTGTICVQLIDNHLLSMIMPLLLIFIALYFAFGRHLSNDDQPRRLSVFLFTVTAVPAVAFYDGFFGPGTGTFFTLAFITLAGFGIAKATAHAKLLNLVSNGFALLVFMLGGHIVWLAGLVMAVGQIAGGQLGAHLVVSRGTRLVRPVIVVMTLLMSGHLLLDHYDIHPLQLLF